MKMKHILLAASLFVAGILTSAAFNTNAFGQPGGRYQGVHSNIAGIWIVDTASGAVRLCDEINKKCFEWLN